MIRLRLALLTLAAIVAASSVARAQSPISARIYVTYGSVSLASSDTFNAVADTNRARGFGVGGQLSGLWSQLIIDGGFSRQSLDGQRVFVDDSGAVFPLGIPLKAQFEPIDIAAGWRFPGSISGYAAGGFTSMKYTETSDFAQAGDDVEGRKSGLLLLGGIDIALGRWAWVGGEVRYRRVKGVLGESGASAAFGEDDLGGVSYAVRVSLGR